MPTLPGLYAWYSVLDVGPPDWEPDLVDGVDQGAKHSRAALRAHTAKHKGPNLEIDAHGGFSTTWSGHISDSSNLSLQELLDPELSTRTERHEPVESKLKTTLDSPVLRRNLFSTLLGCTPVFSSPLYIGVAKDLNRRLGQHTRMLTKLTEVLRMNSEKLTSVLSNPKWKNEFAVRAIKRRLSLENLEVWVFPLQAAELETDELRIVAEAAEWLLNRWHRPALGRR